MKDIKEFLINESKNFLLSEYERKALAELIGIMSGNLGEDRDIEFYKPLYDSLADEEKEQLEQLYEVLDDEYTYKKINRNMIIDDIPILIKIYEWIDDNDAFGENWDLINAFDKIIN